MNIHFAAFIKIYKICALDSCRSSALAKISESEGDITRAIFKNLGNRKFGGCCRRFETSSAKNRFSSFLRMVIRTGDEPADEFGRRSQRVQLRGAERGLHDGAALRARHHVLGALP